MSVRHDRPLLTAHDVFLMREGTHCRLYDRLGAHPGEVDGVAGTHFGVWAPNARQVAVIGDFNGWDPRACPLAARWDGSGVWEGFVPAAAAGERYKYHLVSRRDGYRIDKADPFAFATEEPPRTASVIWDGRHAWGDGEWMARRANANALDAPIAIYEVHAGSWRRPDGRRPPGYRALAHELGDYCLHMGFTHVELMPLMEHPFYGSWGYQCTGFFAPTARYGAPEDFMYLVDHLHRCGIGVILDWVPSHFPDDPHGLAYFDGTHLYEHADPRQGYHPEWHSAIFNYGRNEVRAFLLSSAMCWLDRFHLDGLRVDAVASMLYLDYARRDGEWIPNRNGGRENLDAIEFLRCLNQAAYRDHPGVQTFAEESTSWPLVSRPTDVGGLGFGLKWNMGWMHDTLDYVQLDPVHRRHHHARITFSLWYAFYENFVLPLSHDEVVHGKGSLLARMPGDDWQKFANLRLLLAYMWAHPGKKLLFMGGEFGQWREWNHDAALDWHLLAHAPHAGVQALVRDLNTLLRAEPALHQCDFEAGGFEWVEVHDADRSVLAFLRRPRAGGRPLLVVCNFTPVPRRAYRVGVPVGGRWQEVLNTDAGAYSGSGCGNLGTVAADPRGAQGRPHALSLTLPPLATLFLAPE